MNAENSEGVIVGHERWCKKEIVSQVIQTVPASHCYSNPFERLCEVSQTGRSR